MTDSATGIDALRLAKEILGTEEAVASVVGVRQPSVNYLLNKGQRVPAEWCIPLERATAAKGSIITRHQLRPDLYPLDDCATHQDEVTKSPGRLAKAVRA